MRLAAWVLLLYSLAFLGTEAFVSTNNNNNNVQRKYGLLSVSPNDDHVEETARRDFIGRILASGVAFVGITEPALATVRAVGGAEIACREAGDCLQKGELDGAIGWNWGASDRCDPADPKCGPGGTLLDEAPTGDPVPEISKKVTHKVSLGIEIGRGERGVLNLGLYGDDTPKAVEQLVAFFSPQGLSTASRQSIDDGFSFNSNPVSMSSGFGLMTEIKPGETVAFGIPSQAAIFAKSRGASRAGDDFKPQPRPGEKLTGEASARPHDCAGLMSIPGAGLGYEGNGPEDEAFANAFQITATAMPSMDRQGRKVVGQVLDQESMAFLSRLTTLPTKKGIKGVIPGQNSGPPLLKVSVRGVLVKPIGSANDSTEQTSS